jgi:hypothetical protein
MTDDGAVRVSDADRERAALVLRDAAADGRLTLDELTERLDGAYGAKTRGELDGVISDLGRTAAPSRAPDATRRRRWFVAVMGGNHVTGRFRLDDDVRVVSVMGGTNLDLRGAELAHPDVTITVLSVMGGVNVIVPPGVEVDAHGVIPLMGGRNIRVAAPETPDAPRIRIRGLVLMGGLNVSSRRRKHHGLPAPELPELPQLPGPPS